MSDQAEENLIAEYEKYAEENGFKLNPNKELVKSLAKALLRNESEYGYRYCPCRRISGDIEQDKKNICPCVYHLQEIKEKDHCCCNLFIKK